MIRDILKIDEDLCTGCGLCVPNCHEGALQIIDGKARLISELMCDGLGACIGYCPEGAITIEKREAEPYDEKRVIEQMVSKGKNTIVAHLRHLKDHGETGYLDEGIDFLEKNRSGLGFNLDEVLDQVYERENQVAGKTGYNHDELHEKTGSGCPGSKEKVMGRPVAAAVNEEARSELRHWPVQLHLINPNAAYFRNADLLVSADCVAYSTGGFHSRFLKGKSLVIACPKLDHGTDIYVEKLKDLIDNARVNTITVMMMEVPCCGGLLQMIKAAASRAVRKVPVKQMIIGISGEILKEEWI